MTTGDGNICIQLISLFVSIPIIEMVTFLKPIPIPDVLTLPSSSPALHAYLMQVSLAQVARKTVTYDECEAALGGIATPSSFGNFLNAWNETFEITDDTGKVRQADHRMELPFAEVVCMGKFCCDMKPLQGTNKNNFTTLLPGTPSVKDLTRFFKDYSKPVPVWYTCETNSGNDVAVHSTRRVRASRGPACFMRYDPQHLINALQHGKFLRNHTMLRESVETALHFALPGLSPALIEEVNKSGLEAPSRFACAEAITKLEAATMGHSRREFKKRQSDKSQIKNKNKQSDNSIIKINQIDQ